MSNPPAIPGVEQYARTVTSIGDSADAVAAKARSIGQTMDALSDAFTLITGDDEKQSLGALGLAGVPLMATWRAIRSAAEQLVGQRTGQPLSEWTDFVDAASDRFDAYGRTLDQLGIWARAQGSDAGDPATEAHLTMLADVRVETQAWKVLLGQVARISSLVDAVLDSRAAEGAEREPVKSGKGWRDGLKDLVPPSVMETVTSVGTADIRDWLFRPLLDLRSQVEQLPAAVGDLTEEVSMLEVKLELASAQARVSLGELVDGDVDIIELRVAGTVLMPSLMSRFSDARAEVERHGGHLARLDELRGAGSVDPQIESRLRSRYTEKLAAAESRLGGIEQELTAWRSNGPALVERAGAWIDAELDCLRLRSSIEGDDDLVGRMLTGREVILEVERRRLADVARFLETEEPAGSRSH